MKLRTVLAIFAFGGTVAACNAILGLDPLDAYVDGAGDEGGDVAAGDGAADGGGGAGGEGGSVGELGQAPCDAMEVADEADSIFVTSVGGAAEAGSFDGSKANPFKTIAEGMSAARAAQRKFVRVEEGTYAEALVLDNVTASVIIDGAWKRTGLLWSRDCKPDRRLATLIQAPGDIGFIADGVKIRSGLQNLTVTTRAMSPAAPDTSGSSRIGVLVRGDQSAFFLSNVTIDAAKATPGGVATPGTPGAPCLGPVVAQQCKTAPLVGPPGADGAPASGGGAFGVMGFVPADGQAGLANGTAGDNGAAGMAGMNRTDCNEGCNGGNMCTANSNNKTAETGRCGCGGTAGTLGKAGRGGGASAALLVIGAQSTVSVDFSELVAANGGDASAGGSGGAGGAPGLPAKGDDVACHTGGCCGNCPAPQPNPWNCGCYYNDVQPKPDANCAGLTPRILTGGNAGTAGQPGGRGGNGGGGAGGPSYTVVRVGGANVVFNQSKRVFGAGGKGLGGAPGGSTGESIAQ